MSNVSIYKYLSNKSDDKLAVLPELRKRATKLDLDCNGRGACAQTKLKMSSPWKEEAESEALRSHLNAHHGWRRGSWGWDHLEQLLRGQITKRLESLRELIFQTQLRCMMEGTTYHEVD
jgi:hypothetical protein